LEHTEVLFEVVEPLMVKAIMTTSCVGQGNELEEIGCYTFSYPTRFFFAFFAVVFTPAEEAIAKVGVIKRGYDVSPLETTIGCLYWRQHTPLAF
jgi:hypothetical protein